jgi:hypothetical protein
VYECENMCGSLLCVLFKVFNRGEGLTQRERLGAPGSSRRSQLSSHELLDPADPP